MNITCEEGFSSNVVRMAVKRQDNTTLGDLYIPIIIKSGCSIVFAIVNSIP